MSHSLVASLRGQIPASETPPGDSPHPWLQVPLKAFQRQLQGQQNQSILNPQEVTLGWLTHPGAGLTYLTTCQQWATGETALPSRNLQGPLVTSSTVTLKEENHLSVCLSISKCRKSQTRDSQQVAISRKRRWWGAKREILLYKFLYCSKNNPMSMYYFCNEIKQRRSDVGGNVAPEC